MVDNVQNVSLPTVQGISGRRVLEWVGCGVITLLAAGLCYVLAIGFIYGPQMRAAAESLRAAEIAQENNAFCVELGFVAGTSAFAACTDGLTKVRQRHEERLAREFDIL